MLERPEATEALAQAKLAHDLLRLGLEGRLAAEQRGVVRHQRTFEGSSPRAIASATSRGTWTHAGGRADLRPVRTVDVVLGADAVGLREPRPHLGVDVLAAPKGSRWAK